MTAQPLFLPWLGPGKRVRRARFVFRGLTCLFYRQAGAKSFSGVRAFCQRHQSVDHPCTLALKIHTVLVPVLLIGNMYCILSRA